MSNLRSVGAQRPYVVTSDGHAAALAEASCSCEYRLSMGMMVCCKCGTGVPLVQPTYLPSRGKRD